MWDELFRHLAGFDTAVLNGPDSEGYPYSVRCRPTADPSSRVLRLDLGAAGTALRPGPASLLYHEHDEELWNQKAFLVRGRLDWGVSGDPGDPGDPEGWAFVPEQFVPGIGIGGTRGMARFLIGARRSTAAYLRKRSLARPRVPWDEIDALKGQEETGGAAEGHRT